MDCPQFVNQIRTLLSTLGKFNYNFLENTSNDLTQTLLFGNCHLVQAITQRFLILQLILSDQLIDLTKNFFK